MEIEASKLVVKFYEGPFATLPVSLVMELGQLWTR